MSTGSDLTQSVVRELLDYNEETGELTWKRRRRFWFKNEQTYRAWNTRHAGQLAFTSSTQETYFAGSIFSKIYTAHRIIWLWVTGEWPDRIDHINGRGTDNRWANLRSVTHSENMKNTKIPKSNTSGVIGVRKNKSAKNPWEAYIVDLLGDKRFWCFETFEEAVLRRRAAEILFGYHPNHGRME